VEVVGQQAGLILAFGAPRMLGHLLEADQVGILQLDNFDHTLDPVASIASTDSFMDVVTQ
jgi:hypothetical protein